MQTKNLFISLLLLFSFQQAKSQSFNQFYADIVAQSSYDTLVNNLTTFENLGVKEISTSALLNTKDWILNKYSDFGYLDVAQQDFLYIGETATNVIATKIGCKYPDQFIIIGAHYDTKNGTGTNDNGTGTVLLLEIARLLKDIQTEYSIKFIHFSLEENGLIGSQRYVSEVLIPQNLDIKLMFNIDEVGGVNGMTNNTIICERDEGAPLSNNAQSAIITDELAVCVGLYSSLNTEISYAYSSDYMPFEDNGEIITGFYEKNINPNTHTATDFLINMDPTYFFEVTKAAIGASLHYAIAHNNSVIQIDETLTANQPGLVYQWLDCNDNYSQISGGNGQIFVAVTDGSYAVEITNNGCVDTSSCMPVTTLSIDELNLNAAVKIHPNPTTGIFSITADFDIYEVAVVNIIGETIKVLDYSEQINLSDLANGYYQILLSTEIGNITKKILIQH